MNPLPPYAVLSRGGHLQAVYAGDRVKVSAEAFDAYARVNRALRLQRGG